MQSIVVARCSVRQNIYEIRMNIIIDRIQVAIALETLVRAIEIKSVIKLFLFDINLQLPRQIN